MEQHYFEDHSEWLGTMLFWRSLGMTIRLDFNTKLSSTVSLESVFKKCLKVLRFSIYSRKVNGLTVALSC